MSATFWLRVGAILGFAAVALGAFGAHGLRGRLMPRGAEASAASDEPGTVSAVRRLEVFETGVRYQMYHALAILALGLTMAWTGRAGAVEALAGWSFVAGIVVFSGSLYALGLTGLGWLGAITPLGGLAFLVGWAALAWSAAGPGGVAGGRPSP